MNDFVTTAYLEISKEFMKLQPVHNKYTWHEGIFAWAFTTISWSLMARCESVGKMMLQHLDWKGDSLVITFAKHKGDQGGEGMGREKHVYANIVCPHVCPVLSLGVLTFCKHRGSMPGPQKVFPGGEQESRYGKILRHILANIPETMLGANRKDIGTHSTRKGSANFVMNFPHVNPVAVYIRAGWSLGSVQDRYIHGGSGSDQLIGRAATGLPTLTNDFSTLPPHFSRESLQMLHNFGWENIIDGFQLYPECFRRVIPYLLASIVYHESYLRNNLPLNHPLWNQTIFTQNVVIGGSNFTNMVVALKNRVLTGHGVCKETSMQASGVPNSILIAQEVENLKLDLQDFKNHQENILNVKCNEIMSNLATIPETLRGMIMDHFVVEGVSPLNMADVQRLFDEREARLMEAFNRAISASIPTSTQSQESVSTENNQDATGQGFTTWYWGGKFGRYCPQDFKFPSSDVKTMWDLWHFGNPAKNIAPYKFFFAWALR